MIKRLAAVCGVVVLVAAALVGYEWLTHPDPNWQPAAYGFRFLADVDRDYTFTKDVYYNETDRPIVLRDVRVGSVSPGLTLLGVRIADLSSFSGSPFVFGPDFPPPEVALTDTSTVPGYVLEPGHGVRFLVGIHVTSGGIHEIGSITVDHGSAVLPRSIRLPNLVRVCAPISTYQRGDDVVGCPVPDPPQ